MMTTIEDDAPGEERENAAGFVLAWMALLLMALLICAALAIDVAHWYVEGSHAQKAADAAALAGVVNLPDDFGTAESVAFELAGDNGYTNDSRTTVVAEQLSKPTQLKVTVTRTVDNFFAGIIGYGTKTITRSAVADYEQPVPMGSPSNTMGNEPVAAGETSWTTGDPTPQFWLNIFGAQTPKRSGDAHQAAICDASVDGCTGSTNDDYVNGGYFYIIRVKSVPANGKLAIEVFDPAFVHVGDLCDAAQLDSAVAIDPVRYAKGPDSPFCTGDTIPGGGATEYPVTTFTMRAPDNTPWIDTDNPIITSNKCTEQSFDPYTGDIGAKITSDNQFASYFRQWYRVCEINNSKIVKGDYLVQVRTNASTGDQSAPGGGLNRFALRAGIEKGNTIDGSQISVFGGGRMAIFANARGADTRFFLARVIPGSTGRTLQLNLFDVGDASQPGILTVLPPPDSGMAQFSNCTWTPPWNPVPTALPGCSIIGVNNAQYNGKRVYVDVPIPPGYTCNSGDPFGCWIKIRFTYPPGTNVTDTTTWSATIEGDPVRLVQ